MGLVKYIREEIQVIRERDPAIKSNWEVFLYPSFKVILSYRVAHRLYRKKHYFLARWVSQRAARKTGIEIHPGARIGRGLFIDHGTGVIIGETTIIGNNVTLYQGVTLGGTGKEKGKRHPTLKDNVMVSAGAKILGSFTIGENSKIGAGAVVLKEVPPNCTVVGVPGRIVKMGDQKIPREDMDQVHLPDPVSNDIRELQKDNIREFTMDDIYERTQDGRVIYHNPDDPNRSFSSRMEAQQWIDSFNKQVQSALIQTATQIRDKNAKAAMPALRLLQFAPVYDVMDPAIREVFDDLISDYEVKNRSGKVVGYSCDLEKMAMKAARLAKKYNNSPRKRSANAKMGKQKARKSPALDMKGKGSARNSKANDEPQTIEEAMKRLNEINRRNR